MKLADVAFANPVDVNSYKAGSVSGPISGFKVAPTKAGVNFVAWGQSDVDGKLFNPEAAKTPLSSARIYDSLFVRHWDYWLTQEFQAVFSGSLKKEGRKYSFDGKLNNLVSPIKYAESPYPPFGGTEDYDLSPDGKTVAFMSKAPELPKANVTTSYIFVGPHDNSALFQPINKDNAPEGVVGASSAPKFSPNSNSLAYLQMHEYNYESDRRIIYIADLGSNKIRSVASEWDRSPDSIRWTPDGKKLYVTAEDDGTVKLFSLPSDARASHKPRAFVHEGSVGSVAMVGKTKAALITGSAQWSSANYIIVKPGGFSKKLFYANENDPELEGLSPQDVEEFWFEGHRTKVTTITYSIPVSMPLTTS